MPRLKKIDKSIRLEVQIPTSILSKVQLELYSDLEGKIPMGKMSDLVGKLLTQWLRNERGLSL